MFTSMGRVVIGGLITSTFLTLFVVPLFYLLLDDLRNWFWTVLKGILPEKQGQGRETAVFR